MAYMCQFCAKKVQYGETHTHGRGVAGGRWKKRAQRTRKVFKPNLHMATVEVNGKSIQMRLCVKCLRKLRKPWVPATQTI